MRIHTDMASHIINVEPVRTLDDGTRVVTINTDGAVGAEAEAKALAGQEFGGEAFLSFRSSQYGQLAITYTDRLV